MGAAVEVARAAAIAAPRREDRPFDLSAVGLVVLREPTWTEWEALGEWLRRAEGAIQWWIGDWLVVGEGAFGEAHAQAVDATGWEVDTLLQYRRVAAAVALDRRHPGLSFFHHREVADLEPADQAAWLRRAAEGEDGVRWSVARLRAELNQATRPDAGLWVLVKAKDAADAEVLVARMLAEGRAVKVRGPKAPAAPRLDAAI